jgi:cardiolipin synthase
VVVIVPEKIDSVLVSRAASSFYVDLLEAGVTVQRFADGLLHTKSITVDGEVAMFGTVNLDMRSLWLNYEVSLFVYGGPFPAALRALQETYLARCTPLDEASWRARPVGTRFLDNAVRLVSPLL